MTIIQQNVPSPSPPGSGSSPGWKVGQLVAEVQQRTENRANTKMDFRMEFFLALDQLCNEQHFWWRNKRGIFTTEIGTQSYDLSGISPDFTEIDQALLINSDGKTVERELTPIFSPGQQLEMTLNDTQDVPAGYFIDVQTSLQTFFLQAPPSVAQKILYTYWATPMVSDTTKDNIPILPPWLHYGMISALERRAYLVLYGLEDPRYITTDAEYKEFLDSANNTPSWGSRKVTEARTNSNYTRIVSAHNSGTYGRR